ncbi:hypothetical protein PproGo58_10950 [Pseudomonas protegens]|nr:hypothetical protein PproGo58_10950 [Pseudomonas protegens]
MVTNGHKLIIFLPLANRLFYPPSVYIQLRLADGMTEPHLAIPSYSQERLGIFPRIRFTYAPQESPQSLHGPGGLHRPLGQRPAGSQGLGRRR